MTETGDGVVRAKLKRFLRPRMYLEKKLIDSDKYLLISNRIFIFLSISFSNVNSSSNINNKEILLVIRYRISLKYCCRKHTI